MISARPATVIDYTKDDADNGPSADCHSPSCTDADASGGQNSASDSRKTCMCERIIQKLPFKFVFSPSHTSTLTFT